MSRSSSFHHTTKWEYQPVQRSPSILEGHRRRSSTSVVDGVAAIRGSPFASKGASATLTAEEAAFRIDFKDDARADDIVAKLRDLRESWVQRRRRTWERTYALLVSAALLWVLFGANATRHKIRIAFNKPRVLSKVPQTTFRANLVPGYGYVTSFPYGGFTNQIVELFKLVHIGQRLDRTAIITDLTAIHSEGSDVPLSTFFDLKAFSYYTNVSIVEWRNLKLSGAHYPKVPETLSCWGWHDEQKKKALSRYAIQTTFWPLPGQLTVPASVDASITFPAIEVLASQSNIKWLTETAIKYFDSVANAPAFPDQQLMCFDNLFYVPSTRFVEGAVDRTYAIEEFAPSDPVWDRVGRHLHFNRALDSIADELLLSLLGSRRRPFIGVHIRQGDFVALWRGPPNIVETYSSAVAEVQKEIASRHAFPHAFPFPVLGETRGNLPVVFTTDNTDEAFLKPLTDLGWILVDHREFATVPRFGGWYPGVLDSLILSRSQGFVGTKMSTFSYVSTRRVESWRGGVTRIVG